MGQAHVLAEAEQAGLAPVWSTNMHGLAGKRRFVDPGRERKGVGVAWTTSSAAPGPPRSHIWAQSFHFRA